MLVKFCVQSIDRGLCSLKVVSSKLYMMHLITDIVLCKKQEIIVKAFLTKILLLTFKQPCNGKSSCSYSDFDSLSVGICMGVRFEMTY